MTLLLPRSLLLLSLLVSAAAQLQLSIRKPSAEGDNVAKTWTAELAGSKVSMPLLAFGTGLFFGDQVEAPLMAALKAGYRHVDCAQDYMNWKEVHATINKALQAKVVSRQDLFYASKSEGKGGYAGLKKDVEAELQDGIMKGYIDLYYVHSRPGTHDGPKDWDELKGAWKALEEFYAQGKVKAIGVSNFRVEDLEKLMAFATVKPMVNQIKYSIYDRPPQAQSLEKFCKDHQIQTIAYSPFETVADEDGWGSWMGQNPSLFRDEDISALAKKVGSSSGLVVLNWYYQRGMGVVSRSSSPAHMAQNLKFPQVRLTAQQLAVLDAKNMRLAPGDMLPPGAGAGAEEEGQAAQAQEEAMLAFLQAKKSQRHRKK